jgi:hypothetical protein
MLGEQSLAARDDTSGKVYDYIATGGFASRCDAISRVVDTMMATLGKEKRYYEQKWKEWVRHIETVTGSLYGIAGDLVGLGAEIPPRWPRCRDSSALASVPRFLRRCVRNSRRRAFRLWPAGQSAAFPGSCAKGKSPAARVPPGSGTSRAKSATPSMRQGG